MTHFQWRRFMFFDIKKDVDDGVLLESLKIPESENSAVVTSVNGGRGLLAIGDSIGRLHLLDRRMNMKVISVYPGQSLQLIARSSKSGLIACGSGSSNEHFIKIYDLDKPDKTTGLPTLVRSTRLNHNIGKLSALAIEEDLNLVSVGFDNGTLILIRGDLRRDRGAKQKALLSNSDNSSRNSNCISGIAFRSSKLYVATNNEVFAFNVLHQDKETCTKIDDIGCDIGLTVATDGLHEAHFAMARKEAVYFYSQDGRGQCHAIEGEKTNIFWYRSYLVVVTKESPAWTKNSADMSKGREDKFIITIFDIQNKFIAYSAPVKPIHTLASEWGMLYGLGQDQKLFHLVEKDIQSKLDLLFKKNFYDIAIKIAKSNQYDSDGLVDIFRQYGDHLYNKGDNAAAIENYIKTIGHLEPSYVIRRFLDAHKIQYLTNYLQALHTDGKGLANEDHTILLLNCYTKLKNTKELDEFILKDRDQLDFDVEVAIKVCRQAGYNKHALELAKKHGLHHWYLQIQLEDLKKFEEGLDYICSLDFVNAQSNIKKYGTILMKHLPQKTTEFLKLICTDFKSNKNNQTFISEEALAGKPETVYRSNPEDFLHLFIRNNEGSFIIDFLEYMMRVRPSECSDIIYNHLLEHYLHKFKIMTAKEDPGDKRANVRTMEDKIMKILSSPKLSYDNDHALILCQLHNFLKGTLYLYERKGLHHQILKIHMEMNNVDEALKTCRQFGPQNPNLWVQALQLVGNIEDQKAKEDHIGEILNTIEEQGLMSPLLVIRTLAGSPLANLGIVRQYLLNVYETEEKQIKDHSQVIEQYRVDTAKVRERIHELKASALTIQQSKCAACNHNLELPTVHFLCQHSYHKHCFQSYSDNESECPACLNENKKIIDIVKSQQISRESHDTFHSQLEKSDDGFAIVAEYFGRGMFRKQYDVDDTAAKALEGIKLKKNPIVENVQPKSDKRYSPKLTEKHSAPTAKQEVTLPIASVESSSNPFGSPNESPEKEELTNNPFGEPDEEYDNQLNPFGE